jgi:hypothetical protein
MLQEEIEIDTNGKETIVKRAHNADGKEAHIPTEDRTWNGRYLSRRYNRGRSTKR